MLLHSFFVCLIRLTSTVNWPKVFPPSNSRELPNNQNFLLQRAGINVIGAVKNVPLVRLHLEGITCVHALDHGKGKEFVIEVEKGIETAGIAQVGIAIGSAEIAIVDQTETARSRNHRADIEVEVEIEINEEDVMIGAESLKKTTKLCFPYFCCNFLRFNLFFCFSSFLVLTRIPQFL